MELRPLKVLYVTNYVADPAKIFHNITFICFCYIYQKSRLHVEIKIVPEAIENHWTFSTFFTNFALYNGNRKSDQPQTGLDIIVSPTRSGDIMDSSSLSSAPSSASAEISC